MSHSQDPPRDGVMEAVLKCKDAGVKASSRMLKERHKDSCSCSVFICNFEASYHLEHFYLDSAVLRQSLDNRPYISLYIPI